MIQSSSKKFSKLLDEAPSNTRDLKKIIKRSSSFSFKTRRRKKMEERVKESEKNPPTKDIILMKGFLKDMKTGKSEYFVLYKCENGSASRLESYDRMCSPATTNQANRIIFLTDCFDIVRTVFKRYPYSFVLFASRERVQLAAESEKCCMLWLTSIETERHACGAYVFKEPKYVKSWVVTVRCRGNFALPGCYLVGISAIGVDFVSRTTSGVVSAILMNSIERCGYTESRFYMEVWSNEVSCLLWLDMEDLQAAQDIDRLVSQLTQKCKKKHSLSGSPLIKRRDSFKKIMNLKDEYKTSKFECGPLNSAGEEEISSGVSSVSSSRSNSSDFQPRAFAKFRNRKTQDSPAPSAEKSSSDSNSKECFAKKSSSTSSSSSERKYFGLKKNPSTSSSVSSSDTAKNFTVKKKKLSTASSTSSETSKDYADYAATTVYHNTKSLDCVDSPSVSAALRISQYADDTTPSNLAFTAGNRHLDFVDTPYPSSLPPGGRGSNYLSENNRNSNYCDVFFKDENHDGFHPADTNKTHLTCNEILELEQKAISANDLTSVYTDPTFIKFDLPDTNSQYCPIQADELLDSQKKSKFKDLLKKKFHKKKDDKPATYISAPFDPLKRCVSELTLNVPQRSEFSRVINTTHPVSPDNTQLPPTTANMTDDTTSSDEPLYESVSTMLQKQSPARRKKKSNNPAKKREPLPPLLPLRNSSQYNLNDTKRATTTGGESEYQRINDGQCTEGCYAKIHNEYENMEDTLSDNYEQMDTRNLHNGLQERNYDQVDCAKVEPHYDAVPERISGKKFDDNNSYSKIHSPAAPRKPARKQSDIDALKSREVVTLKPKCVDKEIVYSNTPYREASQKASRKQNSTPTIKRDSRKQKLNKDCSVYTQVATSNSSLESFPEYENNRATKNKRLEYTAYENRTAPTRVFGSDSSEYQNGMYVGDDDDLETTIQSSSCPEYENSVFSRVISSDDTESAYENRYKDKLQVPSNYARMQQSNNIYGNVAKAWKAKPLAYVDVMLKKSSDSVRQFSEDEFRDNYIQIDFTKTKGVTDAVKDLRMTDRSSPQKDSPLKHRK